MKEEDLGIIIGTKDEALWTKVKKESEFLIQQSEDNLKIQREIRDLAERRILIEQGKI